MSLLNRPTDGSGIPYSEALKRFLEEKAPFISSSQHENYRLVGRRFGEFVGPVTLGEISTDHVLLWLQSLDIGKKTWNSYRADLSGIFSWFCAVPRHWLSNNPVDGIAWLMTATFWEPGRSVSLRYLPRKRRIPKVSKKPAETR